MTLSRFAILVSLIALTLIINCNDNRSNMYLATPKHPVISPSGKYLLRVKEGFDGQVHFNRFEIVEVDGGKEQKTVFSSNDHFRTRDTLFFLWDSKDRVWVYSGDLGTFYWARNRDNVWEKHVYGEDDVGAPEFLKKTRPKYHPK